MIAAGIDHVLISTPELEATRAEFQQLGFFVTPRSRHERFGTANYLCVFEDSYLELIGIENQEPSVQAVQEILWPSITAGGGIPALGLATGDAAAVCNTLKVRGVDAGTPETWSRLADTEDGPRPATFTTLFVPTELSPGYTTFFCQHHTPDLVHQRRWQMHANGVVTLRGVQQRTAQSATDIELAYRRFLGDRFVVNSSQCVLVRLGSHQLEFLPPSGDIRYTIRLQTRSLDWISGKTACHARKGNTAVLRIPLATVASVSLQFEVGPRAVGDR
jgi:hypothetical protein